MSKKKNTTKTQGTNFDLRSGFLIENIKIFQ